MEIFIVKRFSSASEKKSYRGDSLNEERRLIKHSRKQNLKLLRVPELFSSSKHSRTMHRKQEYSNVSLTKTSKSKINVRNSIFTRILWEKFMFEYEISSMAGFRKKNKYKNNVFTKCMLPTIGRMVANGKPEGKGSDASNCNSEGESGLEEYQDAQDDFEDCTSHKGGDVLQKISPHIRVRMVLGEWLVTQICDKQRGTRTINISKEDLSLKGLDLLVSPGVGTLPELVIVLGDHKIYDGDIVKLIEKPMAKKTIERSVKVSMGTQTLVALGADEITETEDCASSNMYSIILPNINLAAKSQDDIIEDLPYDNEFSSCSIASAKAGDFFDVNASEKEEKLPRDLGKGDALCANTEEENYKMQQVNFIKEVSNGDVSSNQAGDIIEDKAFKNDSPSEISSPSPTQYPSKPSTPLHSCLEVTSQNLLDQLMQAKKVVVPIASLRTKASIDLGVSQTDNQDSILMLQCKDCLIDAMELPATNYENLQQPQYFQFPVDNSPTLKVSSPKEIGYCSPKESDSCSLKETDSNKLKVSSPWTLNSNPPSFSSLQVTSQNLLYKLQQAKEDAGVTANSLRTKGSLNLGVSQNDDFDYSSGCENPNSENSTLDPLPELSSTCLVDSESINKSSNPYMALKNSKPYIQKNNYSQKLPKVLFPSITTNPNKSKQDGYLITPTITSTPPSFLSLEVISQNLFYKLKKAKQAALTPESLDGDLYENIPKLVYQSKENSSLSVKSDSSYNSKEHFNKQKEKPMSQDGNIKSKIELSLPHKTSPKTNNIPKIASSENLHKPNNLLKTEIIPVIESAPNERPLTSVSQALKGVETALKPLHDQLREIRAKMASLTSTEFYGTVDCNQCAKSLDRNSYFQAVTNTTETNPKRYFLDQNKYGTFPRATSELVSTNTNGKITKPNDKQLLKFVPRPLYEGISIWTEPEDIIGDTSSSSNLPGNLKK